MVQTAPPQSQLNLQLQVPLVVEDIVVLDSHNQPVHGLKAADFTVSDDRKPITPQYFEEHAATEPSSAAAAAQPAAPSLPPAQGANVFTNRNAVPTGAALNILLLDALNTPMADQVKVRRQMLKFLTTLPPGTSIAIYGLSSKLYLLQGFTSDPAQLKAALTAKGSGPRASSMLDNPVTGGPGGEAEGLDSLGEMVSNSSLLLTAGLFDTQMFLQEEVATYQITQRTQRTLEAMGRLARYLSVLPGRKNLIWFSGAFPLDVNPSAFQAASSFTATTDPGSDAQVTTGMFSSSDGAHFSSKVRVMDNLLRRSQIAIYPVDAGGLFTDQSMDASSNLHLGTQATAAEVMSGGLGVGPGTGSITQPAEAVSNFAAQTDEQHKTMNQMAEETGGKAFYGGDPKGALISAIALGSNYYTLSYTPPNGKWDGQQHKIDVKVNQPGLHLTYRRSYYADDPDEENHGRPAPQSSAMQAAMLHGAPDSGGLVFSVGVTSSDNTSGQLSPGGRPDPKRMQPPYRTYTLDAHLDLHSLTMVPSATGYYEATIEYAVVVYDANGEVVNQFDRLGRISLPPDRYAQVMAHGMAMRQPIEVPVKGNYFLRAGVHDPTSDRVGAVEIPVAAVQAEQATNEGAGQSAPGKQ
jgi:VWFA-related protein